VRGQRRLNLVRYDPARSDLLAAHGLLDGSAVQGSLVAGDVPEALRGELRIVSIQNWPTPRREAIEVALRDSLLFATPVAQYWPDRPVSGRVALAGDVARVAHPDGRRAPPPASLAARPSALVCGAWIKGTAAYIRQTWAHSNTGRSGWGTPRPIIYQVVREVSSLA